MPKSEQQLTNGFQNHCNKTCVLIAIQAQCYFVIPVEKLHGLDTIPLSMVWPASLCHLERNWLNRTQVIPWPSEKTVLPSEVSKVHPQLPTVTHWKAFIKDQTHRLGLTFKALVIISIINQSNFIRFLFKYMLKHIIKILLISVNLAIIEYHNFKSTRVLNLEYVKAKGESLKSCIKSWNWQTELARKKKKRANLPIGNKLHRRVATDIKYQNKTYLRFVDFILFSLVMASNKQCL